MEKKDFNFAEFVARVDDSMSLDCTFRSLGERLKFVQSLELDFIRQVSDDLDTYVYELDSLIDKHLKSLSEHEKRS